MRWRGRRESDNIEDGRGQGGGMRLPGGFGRSGGGPGNIRIPMGKSGGGLSTIIILVVLFFALRACGIDPLEMLAGGSGGVPGGGGQITEEEGTPANDEMKQFVGVVLAETEDVWNGIFQAEGQQYQEPTLRLFSGQVQSACGYASAASGPFYCPGDKKVYLDTTFFDQLAQQFGASGDFAQAYVIAHEVGHHVQNQMGLTAKMEQARQRVSEREYNALSVRLELQADCFAGIWAHHNHKTKAILEPGDVEEALNAAAAIGDDALQRKSQGMVVPDSFTHGTSEQRQRWFHKGLETGSVQACDTFNARSI